MHQYSLKFVFWGFLAQKMAKNQLKLKKKPLNHQNSRTQGGFHRNHFGLSVGITTKMARTCQKMENQYIYLHSTGA